MQDEGFAVWLAAPEGRVREQAAAIGCGYAPWPVSRSGLNPFRELAAWRRLYAICRRLRPVLVQTFAHKPNIYGATAARLAGARAVFGGVVGLGYAFGDGSNPLLRAAVGTGARLSA